MNFELTRIRICIVDHVIKHLEINKLCSTKDICIYFFYHSSAASCTWKLSTRNWSKPKKWCAFLFNVKIVYTTRWRLSATPDYLAYCCRTGSTATN